ncbi:MAG TPA: pyrroloquinoline quinone biosynthesis protein PqqB [Nitrospiraceae bacterium]|nr:pyrroloquinoline quinone biosynthesis protein PqqB [Nitrospiraceae bacterium]
MIVRILGSAAGGGFPQWNCACFCCRGVREGLINASPRTQESVGLSADDGNWFLINASPDIRSQIESFGPLHPGKSRTTPIQAIFLTNGDLDHCLGLLSLRENHRLVIYATESVRRGFTEGNVLYRTLQRFAGQVTWRTLKLGVEETMLCADGRPSGLTVKALAVPGKPPIHLEGRVSPSDPELNVGLRFRQYTNGRVLAYLSAVGSITSSVFEGLADADCVMFDGTFWSSDELSASGFLEKSAEDLAHWPVGGMRGSLAILSKLTAPRRVFIHINNTNPILREDSTERKMIEAAGWSVARDGMEIRL